MTVPEVRNRATINGAIEIGRAPGVIQVTFLAPLSRLDDGWARKVRARAVQPLKITASPPFICGGEARIEIADQ